MAASDERAANKPRKWHDCPVCGRPESVFVTLTSPDYDVGVGWGVDLDNECGCILSVDQADAILDPWSRVDGVTLVNELMDDPL